LSSGWVTTRDTSATANPRGAGACVRVSHLPQRRSKRICHTATPGHRDGERALRLCRGWRRRLPNRKDNPGRIGSDPGPREEIVRRPMRSDTDAPVPETLTDVVSSSLTRLRKINPVGQPSLLANSARRST
jgi:hypothetical protein